jgi:hypothetical protein
VASRITVGQHLDCRGAATVAAAFARFERCAAQLRTGTSIAVFYLAARLRRNFFASPSLKPSTELNSKETP